MQPVIEYSIPALYLANALTVAEQHGVDIVAFCRTQELDFIRLSDWYYRISMDTYYHNLNKLLGLVNVSGFGFQVGFHENVGDNGVLGQAMISAPSIKEALNVWQRYCYICFPGLAARLYTENDNTKLLFVGPKDEDPTGYEHLVAYESECIFATFKRFLSGLRGNSLKIEKVTVSYPPPEYADLYTKQLGCPIEFNQTEDAIYFTADNLEYPTKQSNPAVFQTCLQQCELLSEQLRSKDNLLNHVKFILATRDGLCLSQADVSKKLNMSPRNFRRHLEKLGYTYRDLLNKARIEQAKNLLLHTALPPTAIAEQIGYKSVHGFYQSFQRIVANTPVAFREQHRNSSQP